MPEPDDAQQPDRDRREARTEGGGIAAGRDLVVSGGEVVGRDALHFGVVYGDVILRVEPAEPTHAEAEAPPLRNPYKALAAFTADDRDDFFGREALVEQLVSALQPPAREQPGDRLLAVVGASGSGKSSVVRAGLIPNLWRIQGVPWWTVVRITPGDDPFEALATQLGAIRAEGLSDLTTGQLIEDLKSHERGLHRLAERALAGGEHNARLLVFVDQFEELYTLVPKDCAAEREAFIQGLLAAVGAPHGRTVVVLTVRADFYGELTKTETLREWLPRRQVNVGPMSLPELARAIKGPAENVGLAFEEGLVERILDNVRDEPGALPLLQFALTELYERREGRTLTHAAYEAIGGVQGALAQTAEETYAVLTPAQQTAVRAALLRLVTLGEGQEETRRRVPVSELRPAGDVEVVEGALQEFVARRLLTAGEDEHHQPTYEVSHEALIRNWGEFREWLAKERDSQRLMRQLTQDARRWETEGHRPEFLAPRVTVERVQTQLQREMLNPMELAYLDASSARVRRDNRLRTWAVVGSAMAAVVMALLAIFGLDRAWDASHQAGVAQSIALAAQAQLELAGRHPERSVLLALDALENHPYTWQAERVLGMAVQISRLRLDLDAHTAVVEIAAFSPDGTRIVTASLDGTARVWDAATGEEVLTLADHTAVVWSAAFSPDGTRVVTSSADGTAKVWDAVTGADLFTLAGHTRGVASAAFSPDGARIVTASSDGTARVWDALTGAERLTLTGHANDVLSATFSPDGTRIVTASLDGTAKVWDVATGANLFTLAGHTRRCGERGVQPRRDAHRHRQP